MSWTWRYVDAEGRPHSLDARFLDAGSLGEATPPVFPAQGDAESWLGETWRELAAAGVGAVTLVEDDREVYGPMSLEPSTEFDA